uniref:Uncharacterized protein n=1 Tax=Rhizophora mucronata TaxID=61149 RepID=A0A2P2PVU2_RHIMU
MAFEAICILKASSRFFPRNFSATKQTPKRQKIEKQQKKVHLQTSSLSTPNGQNPDDHFLACNQELKKPPFSN